jgi:hypothetical protein
MRYITGSWFQQPDEILYQVPSPYGDIFDFLLEHGDLGVMLAESCYSVAFLAGEVTLSDADVARLLPWIERGGTLVVFASQLQQLNTSTAEALVGARVRYATRLPNTTRGLISVLDTETGWRHNRSAPTPSPFTPPPPPAGAALCVPHGGSPESYYIKTGGNRSVKSGWDGGTQDKCCRVSASGCGWWYSMAACEAALRNLSSSSNSVCLPCVSGEVNIGCPSWLPAPWPPVEVLPARVSQVQRLTSASVLLSGFFSTSARSSALMSSSSLPLALRNRVCVNGSFEPCIHKCDLSTKTGSGQT